MTAIEKPHPLIAFANFVNEVGGDALEITPRPYSRGAYLRVWLPDEQTCVRAVMLVAGLGMNAEHYMPHLPDAGSLHYDGYQFVVTVPVAMIQSVRAKMAEAQSIVDAPREIGPG